MFCIHFSYGDWEGCGIPLYQFLIITFWSTLISQSMHYQPLFAKCSRRKMAKLMLCQFVKNMFTASNHFMHVFNISVTYLQNVEKIQWKL